MPRCRIIALCICLLLPGLAVIDASAVTPSVAVGESHTVVLRSDGKVMTWGSDAFAQLGIGQVLESDVPLKVGGLGPIRMIASGPYYNLALGQDGTVWAWGANDAGQLGDGTLINRGQPRQIAGLADVVFIAAGVSRGYAVKRDGSVWQWEGLLDGSTTSPRPPMPVPGLANVKSVTVNIVGALALKKDGTMWAWGTNSGGSSSSGNFLDGEIPVQLVGMPEIVATQSNPNSGYPMAVAVGRDGSVWKWEYLAVRGEGSQLLGWVASSPVREILLTHLKVVRLSYDRGFLVVFADDGAVYRFRLDTGDLVRATDITAGTEFFTKADTSLMLKDGTLWLWRQQSGAYGFELLGRWSRENDLTTLSLTKLVAISIGARHTLALKEDGGVWAWGDNTAIIDSASGYDAYSQQLGVDIICCRGTPQLVPGLSDIVAIAAGKVHSVALKQDGTVWSWGWNRGGQLGDDTIKGLQPDGTVWSSGWNRGGELGNGETSFRGHPVQVPGISDVKAVAAGICHTLFLKQDGTVWFTGWQGIFFGDVFGAPVFGCRDVSPPPAQIPELSGIIAIAATDTYDLALRQDGTVVALGQPGKIPGENYTADASPSAFKSAVGTPYQVTGLSNIIAVAAAVDHAVALRQDGTVWAWGDNTNGQLGDGTNSYRASPVRMLGLDGVRSIVATNGATLAIKQDGALWATGGYGYGIGGDTIGNATLPQTRFFPERTFPHVWPIGRYGYDTGTGINLAQQFLPVPVPGMTNLLAIASSAHTVAVKQDGTVWSWGANFDGQLGDGTYKSSTQPANVVNPGGNGVLNLTSDFPVDPANRYLAPFMVTTQANGVRNQTSSLDATLSDPRLIAGFTGDVYFTAFEGRGGEPVLAVAPMSLGSNAGKQTGPAAVADPIYSGAIRVGDVFRDKDGSAKGGSDTRFFSLVCMGITVPSLAAKGMVWMRPIDSAVPFGVAQCPTVQTPATMRMYQGRATGPITARTIVASIDPLDEDRGKTLNIYSWAVAPVPWPSRDFTRYQFMQTSSGWAEMREPMSPAATVTVPASGPITFAVTDAMDLSTLVDTHLYIGLGANWDVVRDWNRAGHYYTVE